ncbi:unnamed protein product [Caenorhabditis bovis]|uniref:F-box domain-containing protein n=1 Tax=Caenorhabditis bovis TaxID=2654633 RepID=A0A8S1F649_9PELO|nr:unnamed protein product [Caenorhabditis bovis]
MLFEDFANLDLFAEDEPPSDSYSRPCKTFIKWCKLPSDVQQCVISRMDFFTRYSLSKCSKKMHILEKGPPIKIDAIEINDSERFYCYDCDSDSKADWDIEASEIKKINCKSFRYAFANRQRLLYALNMLAEQVDRLELLDTDQDENFSYRTTVTPDILSHSQIQNAKRFYFWANCNFTEELFLSLKAAQMTFFSSTIHNEAINKFIKKWIKGDGPKEFVKLSIWYRNSFNKNEILKGIFYRNWDDDFKKEAGGFCADFDRVMGGRDCAQIMHNNGKQSATLRISDDSILFIVTGHYLEKYKCFCYSIP